jgi:hypothetical protein
MTTAAIYEFVYKDPYGMRLFTFTPKVFNHAEWTRKENQVGIMEIECPQVMSDNYYRSDSIMEIWRTINGKKYLEGETHWLLDRWNFETASTRSYFGSMRLVDTNHIIGRRIVDYKAETAYSKKSDYIDDMMKAIIRENHGALATDVTRDISDVLTIQVDRSEAPTVEKAFAWRNCLDVLQELAQLSYDMGTYLVFDTVKDGAVTNFRTYVDKRGADRGSASKNKLVFSESRGNLTDVKLEYDYSNMFNAIRAGGQGRDDSRKIAIALDTASILSSPIGRREYFADSAGTVDTLAYIQSEANGKLAESRAKVRLTGRAVDTKNLLYGIHYNYGDIVVVEHKGITMEAHIDTVHITLNDREEELDIRLNGEKTL